MANSKLRNKIYVVEPKFRQYLGSKISYPNLKMSKTRLEQAKENGNTSEYKKRGGDETLEWINNVLKTDRDAIYNTKKAGMESGMSNKFIKSHEKNRTTSNPTDVGSLPKITSGSVSRKIMANTEVYNESLNKEINDIKYLIEYLCKNNKKTKN